MIVCFHPEERKTQSSKATKRVFFFKKKKGFEPSPPKKIHCFFFRFGFPFVWVSPPQCFPSVGDSQVGVLDGHDTDSASDLVEISVADQVFVGKGNLCSLCFFCVYYVLFMVVYGLFWIFMVFNWF